MLRGSGRDLSSQSIWSYLPSIAPLECLLYLIWRAVDLLVQVELTGEYEHSPIVTADNTLTLLKKETGVG